MNAHREPTTAAGLALAAFIGGHSRCSVITDAEDEARREATQASAARIALLEAKLARVLELAEAWSADADFFEAGDPIHNQPRIILRKRKASRMELAAGVARGCAEQLREALGVSL